MSTTFATKLAAAEGHDLRKFVMIDGVKAVLQEDDVDLPTTLVPSGTVRTLAKCLDTAKVDRKRLDVVKRRQVGGGVTLRLIDDDALTLQTLFAVRKRRATFITSNLTAAAVTLNVGSTGGLATAGDVYIGGETISYTNKTATTLTGCTRGAYNSIARKLWASVGGVNNGQAVYSAVPQWVGRKVTLYGYFLNEDGSAPTSSTMRATLGTYVIDKPPQYIGDGVWEVKCVDRIDAFLAKGLYVGVKPIEKFTYPSLSWSYAHASSGDGATAAMTIGVTANDVSLMKSNLAINGGLGTDLCALLTGGLFGSAGRSGEYPGGVDAKVWALYPITALNTTPGFTGQLYDDFTDVIHLEDRGYTDRYPNGYRWAILVQQARIAAFLKDAAHTVALKLLTSEYGDNANGTQDTLAGYERTNFDSGQWRLGAAIPQTDIDKTSFTTVGQSVDWWFFHHEPTTVGEVMAEFNLACESFVYTTNAGALAVRSLSESNSAGSQLTIDSGVLRGASTIEYDEDSVFPSVVLNATYNRATEKYEGLLEINDAELAERFPTLDSTLTIKSKTTRLMYSGLDGTQLIGAPCVNFGRLERQLRRFQTQEGGRGAAIASVTCSMQARLLNIGDVVTLTDATLPDLEGSTISARACRVVSVEPDDDAGLVYLQLQLLVLPRRIAPAARITSAAGAVLTLTQATYELPGTGLSPGTMFGANQKVRVYDVSGNTSNARVVQSVTGTTVTLTVAPAFAIDPTGVDFICGEGVEGADVAPSNNGYTPLTDFIFQVPSDESTYPQADVPRWR